MSKEPTSNLSDEQLELLADVHSYMNNRADADYQGEETGYVANEELKIESEISRLFWRELNLDQPCME